MLKVIFCQQIGLRTLIMFFGILCLSLGSFSEILHASNISLHVGSPKYQFFINKDSNGEIPAFRSVDGIQIAVQIEQFRPFGLGIENYETRFQNSVHPGFKLATRMYNFSYQLMDSGLKFLMGIGVGTQSFQCASCSSQYNSAQALQIYSRLGITPGNLFEYFLQFHRISSKIKGRSVDYEADLGSYLATIGLGVVF